jgi:uncharacterized protein (TIGR00299 family) protein
VATPESGTAPHRGLAQCLERIEAAPLSPAAKRRAGAVFRRIAVAEAAVHGCSVDEVHFHEVGAVDALVDVCGAALALERHGVERVHCTPPYAGGGTVECAHGTLPVPAPGTAEIFRGLPLVLGPGGERLTPTGAAILAECVDEFAPPATFVAERIGYGAGQRDPAEGPPNCLRVQLGQRVPSTVPMGEAWLMEVTLDDATGEELGFLLAALRGAGALEAWSSPVQMKKDRPGVVVAALCRLERRPELEQAVFAHTPSLGLRWTRVERRECRRETLSVEIDVSQGGVPARETVRVVRRLLPGAGGAGPLDLSPEYDDLAAIARARGIALRELALRAVEAARGTRT